MFKKIIQKNPVVSLSLLCGVVYFMSYMTRINYSAVLVEIVAEGYSKAAASAGVTGLFITYGIGQLVSGVLGDRFHPKILIAGGLMVSAAMNILIPFCGSAAAMTVVWCINGFAQAMMWPPLVKIMSVYLTDDQYKKCCVVTSWGGSLGTIAIYLIAPVCISISGCRLLFYFTSAAAAIMSIVYLWSFKNIEEVMTPREPLSRDIHKNEKKNLIQK